MKSLNPYKEQVDRLTSWFKSWSSCQQTIALYSLITHMPHPQARLIYQVLDAKLKLCPELIHLEDEANSPEYIRKLANGNIADIYEQLNSHLPLLRVGNMQAKVEYWKIIPRLLSDLNYVDEARDLLSYSMIHPAVTNDERQWLSALQEQFTATISSLVHSNVLNCKSFNYIHRNNEPSLTSTKLPTVATNNNAWENLGDNHTPGEGLLTINPLYNHQPHPHADSPNCIHYSGKASKPDPVVPVISVAAVVTRPISCSSLHHSPHHSVLHATASAPPRACPTAGHQTLCRTYSVNPTIISQPPQCPVVPVDHKILSPQNSAASSSSGSDGHQAEIVQQNTFLERGSGMRDVPTWLRQLRLHKYSYLFQTMTYEQMLGINEEWLLHQGVTVGASHKIMLNIQKLSERQTKLQSLEKDLAGGGQVQVILEEMKTMIDMPLKAFDSSNDDNDISTSITTPFSPSSPTVETVNILDGDIPGQFSRLLLKVTTQLLVGEPNSKFFQMCRQLLIKCTNHEAFTQSQKKTLTSRKLALEACYSHFMKSRSFKLGNGLPPNLKTSFNSETTNSTMRFRCLNPRPLGDSTRMPLSLPKSNSPFGNNSKRPLLRGTNCYHPILSRCHTNPGSQSSPPTLDVKQTLSRTKSAPLNAQEPSQTNQLSLVDVTNPDMDYAHLESLCFSVTEHALGGDGGERKDLF